MEVRMAAEPGPPPRRFLIATATAHYKNEPAWDRPGLLRARQEIVDLFTGRFGYEHVSDLGLDPTESQLTERLRAFCKSSERREDDLIAVYVRARTRAGERDQALERLLDFYQHSAAVHVKDLARNKSGPRRAQEEDRPCDLLRRSRAPQWNRRQYLL